MTLFVGVDPGLRGCGVGIVMRGFPGVSLSPGGPAGPRVLAAWYLKNTDMANRDCRAWHAMAREVDEALWLRVKGCIDCLVVVEEQQIYQGPLQKGDQADVLQVQAVASAVATLAILRYGVVRVRTVLPAVWKGQMPKEKYHEHRVRSRMSPEDHRRVILPGDAKHQLDVWDGLALAFYSLDKVSRWVGVDVGGTGAHGGSATGSGETPPGGHLVDVPDGQGSQAGPSPVPRCAVGARPGQPRPRRGAVV